MRPGCPGWSWAARARGSRTTWREAFLAGFAARQSVILDGKGDSDFAAAVVDAYSPAGRPLAPGLPSVNLFLDEPLSDWQGSPAEQVNKLLGVRPWSIEAALLQGGLRVHPQARPRAARAARNLHGRAGRLPRPSGPGPGLGQA